MDAGRAREVLDTLLTGVSTRHTETVIVDVTSVATRDPDAATVLIQAAHGVRLLGAELILAGTHADVAQTMVALGISFQTVVPRSSLHRGSPRRCTSADAGAGTGSARPHRRGQCRPSTARSARPVPFSRHPSVGGAGAQAAGRV